MFKYSSLAVEEMQRTGVPASITLAQGILESDSGRSPLAVKGNNHFGIKCHKDWTGERYFKDDDTKNECFRVYSDPQLSFRDHSDFLRYRDRYKHLFSLDPADYTAWANGLSKAGYATDPAYPAKLIAMIEKYKLYRYDTQSAVPEKPEELEVPVQMNAKIIEKLTFPLSSEMLSQNGVPFVKSSEGETFGSIAKFNHLFLREILRFNDVAEDRILAEGEYVYLQPKKRKAARGVDKYIVDRDGENMRDIAQRFGIKLSALVKMNPAAGSDSLSEGETLRLR